jgi:hypothetical protein
VLLADDRDRPLAGGVDEREAAALRLLVTAGVDPHSQAPEAHEGALAQLVQAERRQERAVAGEARELHGGDPSSSGRLRPRLGRLDDLAGGGHPFHPRELDPLDVSHDGRPHRPQSHISAGGSVSP